MSAVLHVEMRTIPFLHAPGGVPVPVLPDPENQIFTFQAEQSGEIWCFHIRTLKALILEHGCEEVDSTINREVVAHLLRHHGVDPAHVRRIVDARSYNEPSILCEIADGTQVMVDGNHRYVARAVVGMTSAPHWLVPESVWRLCLLDVPAEMVLSLL